MLKLIYVIGFSALVACNGAIAKLKLNSVIVEVPEDTVYRFKKEDFIKGYENHANNPMTHIRITSTFNAAVKLKKNDVTVMANQVIPVNELSQLTIEPQLEHFSSLEVPFYAGFSVTDGKQISNVANLEVYFTPVNDPPVVSKLLTPLRIPPNKVFSYRIPRDTFYDPDYNETLKLNVTGKPPWLRFNKAFGLIYGVPSAADTGIYRLNISAVDPVGEQASTHFVLSVDHTGEVSKVPDKRDTLEFLANTSFEYELFSKQLHGNLTTTFGVRHEGLPDWIKMSKLDGVLFGTPNSKNKGEGYTIDFFVIGNIGNSIKKAITFNVKNANTAPKQENTKVTFPLRAITNRWSGGLRFSKRDFEQGFYDSDGTRLNKIRVTSLLGTPDYLYFKSGKLQVNQEISASDISDIQIKTSRTNAGSNSFLYETSDGAIWSNQAAMNVEITDQNIPPVFTPHEVIPTEHLIFENESILIKITLGFSDSDYDDLAFFASGKMPPGIVLNGKMLEGAAKEGSSGRYPIRIHAFDSAGGSAWADFVLNVRANNQPPSCKNKLVRFRDRELVQESIEGVDGDNDALEYSIVSLPQKGQITSFNKKSGEFAFLPHSSFLGGVDFLVKVDDGSLFGTCRIRLMIG